MPAAPHRRSSTISSQKGAPPVARSWADEFPLMPKEHATGQAREGEQSVHGSTSQAGCGGVGCNVRVQKEERKGQTGGRCLCR